MIRRLLLRYHRWQLERAKAAEREAAIQQMRIALRIRNLGGDDQ